MTALNTIRIAFDGGCRPTNPGRTYGSFEVRLGGSRVHLESRKEFGWGTNNEAEFTALLEALDWTIKNLSIADLPPRNYRLEIFTDSTIVANRVAGRNRRAKSEPEQRMHALAMKCLSKLIQFGGHKIQWHSRQNNVSLFGH